jgi:hypothetical protein
MGDSPLAVKYVIIIIIIIIIIIPEDCYNKQRLFLYTT